MEILGAKWVRGDLFVPYSGSWEVRARLTEAGWTFVYDRMTPVHGAYDVVFYSVPGTHDYFTPQNEAVRLWMQMNFPEAEVIS